jgi:cobalt transporter subunit CbtB
MQTNALSTISLSATKSDALKAAIVAFVIGLGLIYVVGFSPIESLHDATHDSRHALSFPCH